jgi:hypothetical protein
MSFRDRSIVIRFPVLAALVALAVLALLVLIGRSTASATLSDGDVVLGAAPNNACTPGTNVNCTSSLTGIVNTASGGDAFHGFSDSGVGLGGFSNSDNGVFGSSSIGEGVVGESTNSRGVTGSGAIAGVEGKSSSGTGTAGFSTSGIGVFGSSGSGYGVWGQSSGAGKPGVRGQPFTASSIGVFAENNGFAGATALKVTGKSSFSRSGKLTVPAGSSSATKSPINLGTNSLVLSTIQGNQAGVYVQGVTQVAGTSGSFTIHLSKSTTANLPVAWFIVN